MIAAIKEILEMIGLYSVIKALTVQCTLYTPSYSVLASDPQNKHNAAENNALYYTS